MAGCGRKPLDDQIHLEIRKLLGVHSDLAISVTNDIDLLATAAGHQYTAKDVVVLIAGTGSVAMRYEWRDHQFCRVGRRGGWGALLGDDGSGFDIGRQSIRMALRSLETHTGTDFSQEPLGSSDPLLSLISSYFGGSKNKEESSDLLSSVLLAGSEDAPSASQTKQRIASCAEVVVDAMEASKNAKNIVISALMSLVTLVHSLFPGPNSTTQAPILMLAGGLMKSQMVRQILKDKIAEERVQVRSVEYLDNAALVGAQFLAQKQWESSAYN